jgi:hypothetical protein
VGKEKRTGNDSLRTERNVKMMKTPSSMEDRPKEKRTRKHEMVIDLINRVNN